MTVPVTANWKGSALSPDAICHGAGAGRQCDCSEHCLLRLLPKLWLHREPNLSKQQRELQHHAPCCWGEQLCNLCTAQGSALSTIITASITALWANGLHGWEQECKDLPGSAKSAVDHVVTAPKTQSAPTKTHLTAPGVMRASPPLKEQRIYPIFSFSKSKYWPRARHLFPHLPATELRLKENPGRHTKQTGLPQDISNILTPRRANVRC